MACNACETGFQETQTIVPSIEMSGSTALLYVGNQGRNIAAISRILLCYTRPLIGTVTIYLRPPGELIAWRYPSATLEPGITALFYQLDGLPAGTVLQAQAEYVEVDCRARSCTTTFGG